MSLCFCTHIVCFLFECFIVMYINSFVPLTLYEVEIMQISGSYVSDLPVLCLFIKLNQNKSSDVSLTTPVWR